MPELAKRLSNTAFQRRFLCSFVRLADICASFDQFPSLIAYAVSETEIPLLIDCAQKNKVKAVVRGGGHQYVTRLST